MPPRRKTDKKPKTGGRPTLLSTEVRETVAKWVKAGADLDVAGAAAGVSKRTLLLWLREGERLRRRKADEPSWEPRGHEVDLFRFAEAVDVARAEAEIGDVVAVGLAARDRKTADGRTVIGDWRAAAYRLDRRDRSRAATAHAAATGGPGVGYSMTGDVDDDDGVDVIEVLVERLERIADRRSKPSSKRER